jgi:hypothetical protein
MAISVLATRCRYCGEEVGRPRAQEQTFTIKDLGGERRSTYTVSGNVLGALESFRAEELAGKEGELVDLNLEKEGIVVNPTTGLPELAGGHKDLAESVLGPAPLNASGIRRKPQAKPRRPVSQYLLIGIGVPIASVVGWFAFVGVQAWLNSRDAGDIAVYNNAMELLEAGQPSIVALERANEILALANTPANREIASNIRRRFIADIQGLLNKNPFSRENLNRASTLATRAALIDGDRDILALKEEVDREIAAYKLVLQEIDTANTKATFKNHNPNYPKSEETVGLGDLVQDRFVVRDILPSSVRLEDSLRSSGPLPRALVARPHAPVTGE